MSGFDQAGGVFGSRAGRSETAPRPQFCMASTSWEEEQKRRRLERARSYANKPLPRATGTTSAPSAVGIAASRVNRGADQPGAAEPRRNPRPPDRRQLGRVSLGDTIQSHSVQPQAQRVGIASASSPLRPGHAVAHIRRLTELRDGLRLQRSGLFFAGCSTPSAVPGTSPSSSPANSPEPLASRLASPVF